MQVGMLFVPNKPWKDKVEAWFKHASHSSQKGCLVGLILSILAWSLWLWHCKARMEGNSTSMEALWHLVKANISWVGLHLKTRNKLMVGDARVLAALSLPFKDPKQK